jgi:hypothetical protein
MLTSTYRIDEQPTTSAVVLSDIAGVLTMAMWIFVVRKSGDEAIPSDRN